MITDEVMTRLVDCAKEHSRLGEQLGLEWKFRHADRFETRVRLEWTNAKHHTAHRYISADWLMQCAQSDRLAQLVASALFEADQYYHGFSSE